jgi:gliding motility-associated-like protein/uncharacterized repeat protein (TIGR01451 family)
LVPIAFTSGSELKSDSTHKKHSFPLTLFALVPTEFCSFNLLPLKKVATKTIERMKLRRTLGIALCCLAYAAQSQTLIAEMDLPEQSLINEEVCFSVNLYNEGPIGYQPYLRLFLPPELTFTSLNVKFMNDPLTTIVDAGLFSGGIADDPNLDSESAANIVNGPDGHRLVILNLPVGSMVEDGIILRLNICATIDGAPASVGTPFDVIVEPVYRYGDTPTGSNDALVGASVSSTLTPTLYRFNKSINEKHYPTGSCWDLEYELVVDIADMQVVTGLNISDFLPADIQFLGMMYTTPGCVVQQTPPTSGPGGTLTVTCSTVVGSVDTEDVKVVFAGFMTDQLDPMSCDSTQYVNQAQVTSNQVALQTAQAGSYGYHLHATMLESGGTGAPGVQAPVSAEFKISEYVDGIENVTISVTIPDGMAYVGNPLFNGLPIDAGNISVSGPTAGVTDIVFDLTTQNGGDFSPCDLATFGLAVEVLETYNNGDHVLSRDVLEVTGSLDYSIVNGTTGCSFPLMASFDIISPEVNKEIISSPANGEGYVPGETVTYRLSMTVPSEDINGVVFEDLFPIPIHDVASLDLTFGNDIYWSPMDNAGLTPNSIYIDEPTNRLYIDWGDLSAVTSGLPKVIAVNIDIDITTEPFANGLTHSNFCKFASSNSLLASAVDVQLASMVVGSPQLNIFKGVKDTDNPDEVFSPVMLPVNANVSGIDAWDIITYDITLVNVGSAPAYDVIVLDLPPTAAMQGCALSSVKTKDGAPVPYTGNLFTSGLVVEVVEKVNAPNNADEVIVEYTCQVKGSVESRQTFQNTASAAWTSAPGNPSYYNPVSDISQGSIAEPKATLTVLDIQPGYSTTNKVHVGELVTWKASLTIPEGHTKNSKFTLTLPEGLAVEELISIEKPIDVTFTAGSLGAVIAATQINDIGSNPEELRRQMIVTFGDIHNAAADNLDKEKIDITFSGVVLNTALNQNNAVLASEAKISYNNPLTGSLVNKTGTQNLTVVEPDLVVTTSLFSDQLIPGQTTFMTIAIEHSPTSTGTAYDVTIVDDLPLGLEYVDDSFILECTGLLAGTPYESFGAINAAYDSIPLGLSCEISFSVKVSEAYPPCTEIDNCADMRWTSTWHTHMDTLSYGPMHPLGFERTGNPDNVGGVLNDYERTHCKTIEVVSASTVTPVINGPSGGCNGQNITLSIAEYPGVGVMYHWTGPAVPPGFNDNELTLNNLSGLAAGSYSVWVEMGDCATDESDPLVFVVNSNPVVDLPDIDVPCTNGTDDLVISPTVTGGEAPFDYYWSGPNSFSSNDPEATIPNADENDEGTYTLYVVDDNNCTSNSSNSTVAVSSNPPPPTINEPNDICQGLSLEFTCSAYSGTVVYHWDTPNGEFTTTQPSIIFNNADNTYSGDYSVWAEVNDCMTTSSGVTQVNVWSIPGAPQMAASSQTICAGETLSFSTSTSASAYHWTGPNGFESYLQAPPIISNVSTFEAGTYTLQVANNGCWGPSSTLAITVLPQPTTPTMSSNSPLCSGGLLELQTTSAGPEFIWTLPGGAQLITSEPFLQIDNANASDGGNYSLVIYNGSCYSNTSPTMVVDVDVIPSIDAFAGDDAFACQTGQSWVQAGNDPQFTGTWTTTDTTLTIVNPNSAGTTILGAITGNSYILTWSLENEGCGVYSTDEVTLLSPDNPWADEDSYTLSQSQSADLFVLANDQYNGLAVNLTLVEEPQHGNADVGQNEYVVYTADDDFSGFDEFIYEICLDECPTICATAFVRLEVVPYLSVPDVITPNGDGNNDVLWITGLENFGSNELFVYNRWGREVYHAVNYQNDWDGQWEGNPLPEGTYYYVFMQTGIADAAAQGFIMIHR